MSTDKPWINNYLEGVSSEIDPDKYKSIVELLEISVLKFAQLPAFECMGKSITYQQLDEYSKAFAAYMQHLGLEKGDRIAIQMPNILQYPVALFGALKAGLTVVNTNPLYTTREMEHQFSDAEVKAVVVVSNFASKVEQVLKTNTSIEHVIITDIGDMLGLLKGTVVNLAVKYLKNMVPSYSIKGSTSFNKILKEGKDMLLTPVDIQPDDHAFLQYTGGTTGVAKGAVLSHKNIITNVEQCQAWMNHLEEGKEVVITPLPLYHVFSLTVNGLMCSTKLGAKIVLITNPRDMKGFIKELKKQPFTVITGVNTLFNALLNQGKFADLDFSNLKLVIAGGMAVNTSVSQRWQKLTGKPLLEGYGLTETSPVVTCQPYAGKIKEGSIGMPFPSVEVVVKDEEGNDLPQGDVGEICVRGTQVTSGYWQREKETAEAFFEGNWFRTGDVGYMDEDGYFYIVDRKKDMINVSGFNVYPNEIEDVLMMHEGVAEVAVIGVPHEKSMEAVKAFVVKKDEHLTDEIVKKFCKQNLTAYKIPKYVEFRTELPKSNVGKVLRKDLRMEELQKYEKIMKKGEK
ncbi:AMP-binding protein [Sediminitomix flava]|uniref:Long-chain-fatty-acid--CoA ligase n=1 Tax=Sediminitomix flava TaxID=379075 RepID=A0A315Z2W3_SEDFL|nr:AMP-binding protein [Sediminitomix flava]PWJ36136.1 long-chain acyl-CoA synthetase [Sediminitomix flava]